MRPMEAFTMDAFAEQCLVQLDLEYFEKLPNTVTVIITAQPEARVVEWIVSVISNSLIEKLNQNLFHNLYYIILLYYII